jgi:hypothetical protein
MRKAAIGMYVSGVIFLLSCGSKDDKPVDMYQSCIFTSADAAGYTICLEAKNAGNLKEICGNSEASTNYAAQACTVAAGTKGCSYRNDKQVEIIEWYTGSSWTDDEMTPLCAERSGSTIVTK